MENFRIVREKIADLKERDYKRLLQPVIDGNEIMELFHLKPSREVGELKKALKEAVLENIVPNEREPLLALLREKAKELGWDDLWTRKLDEDKHEPTSPIGRKILYEE